LETSAPTKSAGDNIRVAVLFQRFGPYHHARLNAAGQRFAVWGVEACAEEDTYAWDKIEGAASFQRRTLTARQTGNQQWKRDVRRAMWQALDEIKPHAVVLPGWASVDAFSALAWCLRTGTPAIIMSESTYWDEPRIFWKEWIKGRLVKLCEAGFAGGTPHANYLAQLGLPREKIFLGYDSVDNEYFQRKADEARAHAAALRKDNQLPEKFFLASARFVEKKNLFNLVRAFARYRVIAKQPQSSEAWDLVLLGDGALKPGLVAHISELGMTEHIHLPGFKQYRELPVYFGLAQAFVHPSTTEQWGLVVNEAMASGLPVLVSNRCGCALDLVAENANGFTFAPDNVDELAQLMLKVSAENFPLAGFGAHSRRIIANWGPERFASGLHDAVITALKQPRREASLLDRILLKLLLYW
jgi:glycosyltransferase involved in cell wall biosynthesis